MPLLDGFAHDFTLVMDIHEDQNVGHQMPILDDLALLVARVGSNGALIAEGNELNEVVEPLTDGGGVIHGPSEFGLSQVFEQIGTAKDLPELLEGIVQFMALLQLIVVITKTRIVRKIISIKQGCYANTITGKCLMDWVGMIFCNRPVFLV
jgi:hypothetical protein